MLQHHHRSRILNCIPTAVVYASMRTEPTATDGTESVFGRGRQVEIIALKTFDCSDYPSDSVARLWVLSSLQGRIDSHKVSRALSTTRNERNILVCKTAARQ